jgi:predicted DNA-binding protein (MmcQ/YjbR family)
MDPSWVRGKCRSFPAATEHNIWGSDLTFKVGGKMFAHTVLEPSSPWISFKTSPDNFFELTERLNIIPAPYLARAQWIALETRDALTASELSALLREAYDLIAAKLPRKTRDALTKSTPPKSNRRPTKKSKPKAKPHKRKPRN